MKNYRSILQSPFGCYNYGYCAEEDRTGYGTSAVASCTNCVCEAPTSGTKCQTRESSGRSLARSLVARVGGACSELRGQVRQWWHVYIYWLCVCLPVHGRYVLRSFDLVDFITFSSCSDVCSTCSSNSTCVKTNSNVYFCKCNDEWTGSYCTGE